MDFSDLAVGPAPQLPRKAFQARRDRVAEALGDDRALVVTTHAPTTHSNDVEHVFRPHSDFWYLTGFAEPGATLILEGGNGATTLFLQGRRPDAEIWTGRRLGVERAPDALGVDRAVDADDLGTRLRDVLGDRSVEAVVGHDATVAGRVRKAARGGVEDGAPRLARMRRIKDADEVRLLRQAAEVGNAAMTSALGLAQPGRHEFELEAELLRSYRAAGSTGPGYPPIVGAGANAAVLHYIANRDRIERGDLVLVDAGCEWGYYNSDITRTVPAGGAWTGEQEALYALVWEAQQAALAQVRPGNTLRDPHDAAVRVLTEGLVERGWLDGDPERLLEEDAHRRFYMHGTSHLLGLDVHDVGAMKEPDGGPLLLRPGMVLTVEPGLYANPDYATLPAAVDPFGIRIENDVVVTEDGHEDLQAGLATAPDDVAALARGA